MRTKIRDYQEVPAEVVYHKENKVWIYVNGNFRKVAAVKFKPYELVSKEEDREIEKKDEIDEEEKFNNIVD